MLLATTSGCSDEENRPPRITDLNASITNPKPGDTVIITVIADDPEGVPLIIEWSVERGNIYPNDDPKSAAYVVPNTSGHIDITVTVTDGKESTKDVVTIAVIPPSTFEEPVVVEPVEEETPAVEPTTSPDSIINIIHPDDQVNTEGESINLSIVTEDPDRDSLTYSAEGLPPGLSINSGTGAIIGAITETGAGSYDVIVTVDDGVESDDTSFTWTVIPKPNRLPIVTNPGNKVGTVGESTKLTIVGDDPDGDSLTYSAEGLPPGLSINSRTGAISGVIDESSSGSYDVIVTVDDGVGSSSTSITWRIEPEPRTPTFVYDAVYEPSSDSDLVQTIDLDVSQPIRTIRINLLERGLTELYAGFSLYEVEIYGPGTGNLALDGTASASDEEVTEACPDCSAEKAIDGIRDTRWSTQEKESEWLEIDLGTPQEVNKIVLRWERAYAKKFCIKFFE
jgi:hypothetical protein